MFGTMRLVSVVDGAWLAVFVKRIVVLSQLRYHWLTHN